MIGLLVLGFLFFSGNSLFAQSDFESCLEIERLKAKNEGASFSESREHAKDSCNLQFEEKKEALSSEKQSGFFISISSNFSGKGKYSSSSYQSQTTVIFNSSSSYGCDTSGDTIFTGYFSDKICSVTATGYSPAGDPNVKDNLSYKIGYKFSNFRIYYTPYKAEFEEDISIDIYVVKNETKFNLLFADYLYQFNNFEFFIGVGLGNGKYEAKAHYKSISSNKIVEGVITVKDDFLVIGYNAGINYNLTENFQLGLGYRRLIFDYTPDSTYFNGNQKYTSHPSYNDQIIVSRENLKAPSTIDNAFIDLIYSF